MSDHLKNKKQIEDLEQGQGQTIKDHLKRRKENEVDENTTENKTPREENEKEDGAAEKKRPREEDEEENEKEDGAAEKKRPREEDEATAEKKKREENEENLMSWTQPDIVEAGGVLPPMAGGNPNKKTLVLDLDGTLVQTVSTYTPAGYDFCINLEGYEKPIYVFKRPGVDELLQQLGSTGLYEIAIFTAGIKPYADAVIDKILDSLPATEHNNTNRNIIPPTHRLARDHCSRIEGVPQEVKDLSILGRNLKNVIIVDDRPTSFYLQPQNGIEIDCWTGAHDNRSLFKLLDFCLKIEGPKSALSTTKDVRELIKLFFFLK